MEQQAQRGASGIVRVRSYTFGLSLAVASGIISYVYYDTGQGGPHYLSAALGIDNSFWIWVSLIVVWFIEVLNNGSTYRIYRQFAGLPRTIEDRAGFVKAAGLDITFWSTALSCAGTLYVFARFVPAGALGIFRPFVALLVFYVIARILLVAGGGLVFSALYKSARTVVLGAGLFCQHFYLPGRRCTNLTYGTSQWCRWHKVLQEFRQDNRRLGDWATLSHMFGAGLTFSLALSALWFFSRSLDIIWFSLIFFAFGWGCMLFADGIMARDYPLSQFAAWAKLLTIGMCLAVIGGVAMIAYAIIEPAAILPLAMLLAGYGFPWLPLYGQVLLVLVVAIFTVVPARLLMQRIWFWQTRYPSLVLGLLASGAVGLAMRHVLEQLNPLNLYSPDTAAKFWIGLWGNRFWEAVLGDNVGWTLGIAYFIGFGVCEFLNVRMRRRRLNDDDFKKTVWPSYPVCALPPVLTLFAARYLLFWVSMTGAVPFVLLASVLCIPLCIFGTRIVIARYV